MKLPVHKFAKSKKSMNWIPLMNGIKTAFNQRKNLWKKAACDIILTNSTFGGFLGDI
ncbi:hypothetical protein [Aquirufa rosea]|uniref:hypothetical protein n=1 Tax=Aquirufa rosea TaxID=2509241 RepID=UPI0013E98461|nr:hypothetical protein [Aquirufa rosea]